MDASEEMKNPGLRLSAGAGRAAQGAVTSGVRLGAPRGASPSAVPQVSAIRDNAEGGSPCLKGWEE